MQAVAPQVEFLRRSGIVIAVAVVAGTEWVKVGLAIEVQIARCVDGLSVEAPGRAEFQAGVNAAHAVVLAGRGAFPVRVKRSDARLLEDVAAGARDREIRAHARQRAEIWDGKPGAPVVGRHQPDGVRPVFARQANSGGWIADAAGKK